MQNYDYARKLNSRTRNGLIDRKKKYSFLENFSISKSHKGDFSSSIFTILVGSICIFTAGLIIGLQLNEQEKINNNELLSLKNISNQNDKLETSSRSRNSSQYQLFSPPKKGQMNYLIKVYSDTDNDFLISLGQEIIEKEPSLSNKIFRTSNGDLYIGYIYSESEAKSLLKKIRKIEAFNELRINNIKALKF